ncbi:MAG: hypothetical protein CL558_06140 [Alphaproteobacteria bacterium]|nr:hypothetical protein [Alphaproteobacteria bacterium]
MTWALALGCANPTALTIHNGSGDRVQIEGLPSGTTTIEAGQLARIEGIRKALQLQATAANGTDLETAEIPLAKPGGESVWAIGAKACMVEANYDQYYANDASVPASVEVRGILRAGQNIWTSQGAIAAGPGQRLPASRQGQSVQAIVQVPCDATVSEAIARGWLEMTLDELQP